MYVDSHCDMLYASNESICDHLLTGSGDDNGMWCSPCVGSKTKKNRTTFINIIHFLRLLNEEKSKRKNVKFMCTGFPE